MPRYAKNTTVNIGRTKEEIERTLRRYGASEFAYMQGTDRAMIGFILEGRKVELTINLPEHADFELTVTGRYRCDSTVDKLWDQACRQRWRALLLILKAKLEAIDCEIATIDDEFLAYIALPSGETIGSKLSKEIAHMVESGKVPKLLPST